jgi:hypothetical protein
MRQPKSPEQFDRDVRKLLGWCSELSVTSWYRSPSRNAEVGGHPKSKHIIGMAVDLVSRDNERLVDAQTLALNLGLWTYFDLDSDNFHLHIQGLPPGPISTVWMDMFLTPAQRDLIVD